MLVSKVLSGDNWRMVVLIGRCRCKRGGSESIYMWSTQTGDSDGACDLCHEMQTHHSLHAQHVNADMQSQENKGHARGSHSTPKAFLP